MRTTLRLLSISLFSLLAPALMAQNVNVSNGIVFDGEPYLTVNPNNGRHLVVAWMGFQLPLRTVIKTSASFDGGQTWSTVVQLPHLNAMTVSADPSLAFGRNGDLFLCYIDFRQDGSEGLVWVSRSTDGGLTWGTPAEVISLNDDPGKLPLDRPWMVVDTTTGPNSGNVYVTTMNATLFPVVPPYHPYITRSTDGGNTFEPPQFLDDTGFLSGNLIPQPMPTPAMAADGTLHAIYPSFVLAQNILPQNLHASSADGGNSFTYHVAQTGLDAVPDTLAKKGPLLIADPTDANHLVFLRLSEVFGDADVLMIESMDAGQTWSAEIRVNDDPVGNDRMQDLIWADFDADGDLAVCWRDRRNSGASGYQVNTEIWGAIRWKDSADFSANFRVSDTAADHATILNESGNDFMSVQFQEDTLSAVWGDVRSGILSIWFQRMAVRDG
ncbi:MAG: sialidase family protein, partial [Bacteroidota bacterium]